MYYYFDIDNIWARIRQCFIHENYLIHKNIVVLEYSNRKKWRLLVTIIIIIISDAQH
jgi:hypothetical protein